MLCSFTGLFEKFIWFLYINLWLVVLCVIMETLFVIMIFTYDKAEWMCTMYDVYMSSGRIKKWLAKVFCCSCRININNLCFNVSNRYVNHWRRSIGWLEFEAQNISVVYVGIETCRCHIMFIIAASSIPPLKHPNGFIKQNAYTCAPQNFWLETRLFEFI